MATSYETIFDRFTNKCTDFNLPKIKNSAVLSDMLLNWLCSAIVSTRKCQHDLSKRDDDAMEFEEDLSDLEIELLARGMINAWLDQYLNSTENVLQFIGGKEEKYYSQANHIAELRALREQNILEMNRLHNYYTYTNSSYFN